MTDSRPPGKNPRSGPVPNWVVIGAVGVFLVVSGLLTYVGSRV